MRRCLNVACQLGAVLVLCVAISATMIVQTPVLSCVFNLLYAVSESSGHVMKNSTEDVKKETTTKTCLYNFDPLKLHFYVVKLGFTWVYRIFLNSAQNLDCGYLLEPPRRTHNLCFEQKYEKYQNFYLKIFIFSGKIFSIFEQASFRNDNHRSYPTNDTNRNCKQIKKMTVNVPKKRPQSQSTAFLFHPKKERRRTKNDKTNATIWNHRRAKKQRKTATEEPPLGL